MKEKTKYRVRILVVALAAALALVSFAAGLNGVRLLMNLYVPLAAACAVLLLVRFLQAPLGPGWAEQPQVRAFAAAVLACVCGCGGYLVNRVVLAARYTFLDQSARSWTALSLTGILEVWGDFLALFGYPADRWQQAATGAVPLFSLPGLLGELPVLYDETLTPSVPAFTVESDFSNVINAGDMDYWPQEARDKLLQNGFLVVPGVGDEFFSRYEMNRYGYIPNFITVDSSLHTYHLYFLYLQKQT